MLYVFLIRMIPLTCKCKAHVWLYHLRITTGKMNNPGCKHMRKRWFWGHQFVSNAYSPSRMKVTSSFRPLVCGGPRITNMWQPIQILRIWAKHFSKNPQVSNSIQLGWWALRQIFHSPFGSAPIGVCMLSPMCLRTSECDIAALWYGLSHIKLTRKISPIPKNYKFDPSGSPSTATHTQDLCHLCTKPQNLFLFLSI